ncbi:hypothetical protein BS78_03G049600 [Paspalum vaginatum]|nr:hypothetical protein BS78_03G049600 [Paspalum vaginatum]
MEFESEARGGVGVDGGPGPRKKRGRPGRQSSTSNRTGASEPDETSNETRVRIRRHQFGIASSPAPPPPPPRPPYQPTTTPTAPARRGASSLTSERALSSSTSAGCIYSAPPFSSPRLETRERARRQAGRQAPGERERPGKKTSAPMCEHTHTDSSRGRRSGIQTTRRATTTAATTPRPRSCSEGIIRGRSMATCRGKKQAPPRGAPIIASLVVPLLPLLLLLVALVLVPCAAAAARGGNATALFRAGEERQAYRRIMARMARMEKHANRTIQSPDGDVIHCVPCHLQPAFDHPRLRGQRPEDEPAERPSRIEGAGEEEEVFAQAWSDGGRACPEGTVPIRRTTARDVLRSSSARRFGMKPRAGNVRRDSTSNGHEHAVGYVTGDQFYGAKASLNVWSAKVASAAEFSLSQIWVISGSFGNDLNTIEAGWQVSPELYGDNSPRFFTYWTTDAYQETGCYNLHCSGFIQTNNRIAIGAAISPTSVYNGRQFDISLLIWKDPHRGNWWLQLGSGPLVGYWPSFLFTHLGGHANMVQFGGEVVNSRPSGSHTPTQMGSGHFPREGFNRAAYFRNVQVVDGDNSLVPAAALRLVADHPGCYDIKGGYNRAWGNYFYYGGPGRNVHCP